jgi:uncharacterized protein YeaO (DUF488 family)
LLLNLAFPAGLAIPQYPASTCSNLRRNRRIFDAAAFFNCRAGGVFENGIIRPEFEKAILPGESESAAYYRLQAVCEHCMLRLGYRYTRDCSSDWAKRASPVGPHNKGRLYVWKQSMNIILQRPYHFLPEPGDYVVLVDRLWPRGVSKATLKLDEWNKDVAPSNELRRWFNHEAEKWEAFRVRYLAELESRNQELRRLQEIARHRRLVLLHAAKSQSFNHAVILRQAIESA